MWTILKAVALRFAIGRTFGGLLTTLVFLAVPLAGVLKIVGIPVLIVLGVVGAPLFLLLAAIGLPVMIALGVGAVLMLAVGALLTLSIFAIKIILPIVLLVWFIRWLRRPTPPASDLGTTE
jgi:hypothetical protein